MSYSSNFHHWLLLVPIVLHKGDSAVFQFNISYIMIIAQEQCTGESRALVTTLRWSGLTPGQWAVVRWHTGADSILARSSDTMLVTMVLWVTMLVSISTLLLQLALSVLDLTLSVHHKDSAQGLTISQKHIRGNLRNRLFLLLIKYH